MRQRKYIPVYIVLGMAGLLMALPVLMMVCNSVMGGQELKEAYGAVLGDGAGRLSARLLPVYPTLQPYVELLLDSPDFFVMFWNSVKQVFAILLGQMAVGTLAAWVFARYEFRGRKILFLTYMILMVMPFQVTMVSSYLVLSRLSLLDSHLSLILPGIFSTFPVFIMEKFFRGIPGEVFEAAKVDGAGELTSFLRIGIPLGSPGIISALLLSFLEYWNAMEAPMTFLKTKAKMPLSLYLPEITADQMSASFTASVIMMLPAVLGFLWGRDYLQKGIEASGLKE
ncbi:MAG: carbohydrate ABC transporter permease [Lachnospiraceae bacterium]